MVVYSHSQPDRFLFFKRNILDSVILKRNTGLTNADNLGNRGSVILCFSRHKQINVSILRGDRRNICNGILPAVFVEANYTDF